MYSKFYNKHLRKYIPCKLDDALEFLRKRSKEDLESEKENILPLLHYLAEMYGLQLKDADKEMKLIEDFETVASRPGKVVNRKIVMGWGRNFLSKIKHSSRSRKNYESVPLQLQGNSYNSFNAVRKS